MSTPEPLAYPPTVQSQSLVAFFELFSRFEYALKRADYCTLGDEGGVRVDWYRFQDDLRAGGAFRTDATPKLSTAVSYLLDTRRKRRPSSTATSFGSGYEAVPTR